MAQVVECLPSMAKDPEFKPSTAKIITIINNNNFIHCT
jgi:hypothetical protein